MKEIDQENYCKDCKRSIYGEYKDCLKTLKTMAST